MAPGEDPISIQAGNAAMEVSKKSADSFRGSRSFTGGGLTLPPGTSIAVNESAADNTVNFQVIIVNSMCTLISLLQLT